MPVSSPPIAQRPQLIFADGYFGEMWDIQIDRGTSETSDDDYYYIQIEPEPSARQYIIEQQRSSGEIFFDDFGGGLTIIAPFRKKDFYFLNPIGSRIFISATILGEQRPLISESENLLKIEHLERVIRILRNQNAFLAMNLNMLSKSSIRWYLEQAEKIGELNTRMNLSLFKAALEQGGVKPSVSNTLEEYQ